MDKIFMVFRKWLVISKGGEKCQENFLISAVNVMYLMPPTLIITVLSILCPLSPYFLSLSYRVRYHVPGSLAIHSPSVENSV